MVRKKNVERMTLHRGVPEFGTEKSLWVNKRIFDIRITSDKSHDPVIIIVILIFCCNVFRNLGINN